MSEDNIYFRGDRVLIINDSIFQTKQIPRNSIDLIVTSPPYNIDIDYNSHDDTISYPEYKKFSKNWMKVCYNLLKDDGRFCLNIPLDKNRGGQQSVGADLTQIAKDVGFKYHTTIVWNEGNISRRTAWGSWKSASAPYVISPVELIVVFYKKRWKKTSGSKESDIERQDFLDWTNGLWSFSGESKRKIGHPAPFPVALPRRCIQLFSFVGDTILDPFLGSGTTLVASYLYNRKGIGIDIDPHYCQIALNRLKKETEMEQASIKKLDTHDKNKKNKKKMITQTDVILQRFKDNPTTPMSYKDMSEWIKEHVANKIFKDIKAYEKIMRTLANNGEIIRLGPNLFVYENEY
ncbi:MAG TPA: site-specific DNA-methyltransferase [Methanoregula sp.]|nr:site-specific DNA-methyltransferase [Methanoregula sp.]